MRFMASVRGRGSVDRHPLAYATGTTGENEDVIGQEHRLVDLVGDEEHGLAPLLPDAQELGLHDLAALRIERGERLVHEQDLRVDRQRAGKIDALAHAAGKLAREIGLESAEPDEGQQIERAPLLPLARMAGDLRADHRVGEHGAPRQEAVLLEDEAAVAAGSPHGAAVDRDLA